MIYIFLLNLCMHLRRMNVDNKKHHLSFIMLLLYFTTLNFVQSIFLVLDLLLLLVMRADDVYVRFLYINSFILILYTWVTIIHVPETTTKKESISKDITLISICFVNVCIIGWNELCKFTLTTTHQPLIVSGTHLYRSSSQIKTILSQCCHHYRKLQTRYCYRKLWTATTNRKLTDVHYTITESDPYQIDLIVWPRQSQRRKNHLDPSPHARRVAILRCSQQQAHVAKSHLHSPLTPSETPLVAAVSCR